MAGEAAEFQPCIPGGSSAEEEKQDGGEFWRGYESAVEKAEDRKGNGKEANNQKEQKVPNNPFSQRANNHGFIPLV